MGDLGVQLGVHWSNYSSMLVHLNHYDPEQNLYFLNWDRFDPKGVLLEVLRDLEDQV